MTAFRSAVSELGQIALRHAFVAMIAFSAIACGDPEARKVTDRFLAALRAEDYAAAYGELHSDARASVPDEDTLRRLVEGRGRRITEWSRNCGSGADGVDRGGYNFSSTVTDDRSTPVTIGVEPANVGKCKGPLLVELRREDGAWKVRTLRY
ncbi:MAG: hypothetical protein JNL21_35695 [Myxococcales bacterium]|nr:hypothetical protein [Myxococcales bacterium]